MSAIICMGIGLLLGGVVGFLIGFNIAADIFKAKRSREGTP